MNPDAAHHAEAAFGPFINSLAHASAAIIARSAAKVGQQDIAFPPVGTGPFEFVGGSRPTPSSARSLLATGRRATPRSTRSPGSPCWRTTPAPPCCRPGEADFAHTLPYEQAALLKKVDKIEVVSSPSIIVRFLAMNVLQKPHDNPKVRQAIAYAINKEALAKVAFGGFAQPAAGFVPAALKHGIKMEPIPYNVQKRVSC